MGHSAPLYLVFRYHTCIHMYLVLQDVCHDTALFHYLTTLTLIEVNSVWLIHILA